MAKPATFLPSAASLFYFETGIQTEKEACMGKIIHIRVITIQLKFSYLPIKENSFLNKHANNFKVLDSEKGSIHAGGEADQS